MALMNCPECNKEISTEAVVCPNCGYVISKIETQTNEPKPNKKNSVISIVGMCISIISFVFIINPLPSIIGSLLSVIGLFSIIKNKDKGYVFAIIGILTGVISTIITFIFLKAVKEYPY